MASRILTIMFTDIKDFTKKTAELSRDDLKKLIKNHEEILYPIVDFYRGKIIKTIGDALLISFLSPQNAVNCGITMQDNLKKFNEKQIEKDKIVIRVAINTGEVETTEKDVFGTTVNLASRVESVTEGGEIFLTENVIISLQNSKIPIKELGEYTFKGISDPVKLYKVNQDFNNADFINYLRNLNYVKPIQKKEVKVNLPDKKNFKPAKNPVVEYFDYTIIFNAVIKIVSVMVIISVAGLFAYNFFTKESSSSTGFFASFFSKPTAEDYLNRIKNQIENFKREESKNTLEEMFLNYPEETEFLNEAKKSVLNFIVDDFLLSSDYEGALSYMQDFQKKYKYHNIDSVELKILIPNAEFYTKIFQYDKAEEIYDYLISKHGKTPEIINSKKIHLSNQTVEEEKKFVQTEIVENITENIDKKTTINDFDFSIDNRRRFAEFIELNEKKQLTSVLRIKYYIMNILFLKPVGEEFNNLKNSVQVVSHITSRDDWGKIKNELNFNFKVSNIASFEFFTDISAQIAELISSNFFELVESEIHSWINVKNKNSIRYYSFLMLQNQNKLPKINLELFHINTLTNEFSEDELRPYIFLLNKALDYFMAKGSISENIAEKSKQNITNIIHDLKFRTSLSYKKRLIPDFENIQKRLDEIPVS